MNEEADVTLVTGFPAFLARRLATRLAERDRVVLLARPKLAAEARAFVAGLPAAAQARVRVLHGDVCDLDCGLAGAELRELAAEVTCVHHAAFASYLAVPRPTAQRVNVGGTRALLELAAGFGRLRRFVHWSTASVSGTRAGIIMEDELDCGQRFANYIEETRFQAELAAAEAARQLPVTVLRPATVVGDSRTGEIDRFEGPYTLIVVFVRSPLDVSLPLPGRGSAPLHIVPIDYVVAAAVQLGRDPRAAGLTFHLTDPSPLSSRRIYELVARAAHRKPPRGSIPQSFARAVLRAPGLGRLARVPLSFLESLNRQAFYNSKNALELLRGTGIACPPFERYVDPLVGYVREVQARKRQEKEEAVYDPFD